MYCSNHPATQAIGACSRCGMAICQNCSSSVDGKLICKTCAEHGLTALANKNIGDKSASAQGPKKDSPIPIILLVIGIALIGLILIVAITFVLAAVIAAFVFVMVGSVQHAVSPAFVAQNINDTAISITLVDTGGATSIKGLIVEQPSLTNMTIVDPDTEIALGRSYTISDPALAGTSHLVVVSTVDGGTQVVMDTQM